MVGIEFGLIGIKSRLQFIDLQFIASVDFFPAFLQIFHLPGERVSVFLGHAIDQSLPVKQFSLAFFNVSKISIPVLGQIETAGLIVTGIVFGILLDAADLFV